MSTSAGDNTIDDKDEEEEEEENEDVEIYEEEIDIEQKEELDDNQREDYITLFNASEQDAKRARRQYKKEIKLAEFAKYYFAGYSEEQICAVLQINRSTYYRYLTEIGNQHTLKFDDEHLQAILKAEVASYENLMRKVILKMQSIMNKSDDDMAKIEAANVLLNTGKLKLKLYDPTSGVIPTIRSLPLVVKREMDDVAKKDEVELIEVNPDKDDNVNTPKRKKQRKAN